MSTALSQRHKRSPRVVPVDKLYRTLGGSGHLNDFFDLAQGCFACGIEQRLKKSRRVPKSSATCIGCPRGCFGWKFAVLAAMVDRSPRERVTTRYGRVVPPDGCGTGSIAKAAHLLN
jgi:hypothetical protein